MRYKRRDNVVFRRIAGETLLIPIRGTLADLQRVFVLEGAGEFIWQELDGAKTVEEIRDAVAGHFEVGVEDAWKDVQEFIAELSRRDLIAEAD
jgi:hypothetical protein